MMSMCVNHSGDFIFFCLGFGIAVICNNILIGVTLVVLLSKTHGFVYYLVENDITQIISRKHPLVRWFSHPARYSQLRGISPLRAESSIYTYSTHTLLTVSESKRYVACGVNNTTH